MRKSIDEKFNNLWTDERTKEQTMLTSESLCNWKSPWYLIVDLTLCTWLNVTYQRFQLSFKSYPYIFFFTIVMNVITKGGSKVDTLYTFY